MATQSITGYMACDHIKEYNRVRPTSQSFAEQRDLFVLLVQWTEPMAAVTV